MSSRVFAFQGYGDAFSQGTGKMEKAHVSVFEVGCFDDFDL